DAVARAAGELVRISGKSLVGVRYRHAGEEIRGPRTSSPLGEFQVHAHVVGQLRADGELRVQARGGVLEHHGDLRAADRAQRAPLQTEELRPGQADRPTDLGGRGQQAEDGHRAHALARAGLPGEPLDPAGREIKIDSVHDRNGIAPPEGDREITDLQLRRHATSSPGASTGAAAAPSRSAEASGSSASRMESPMKLNAITTVRIARPGKTPSHHASVLFIAVEIIAPHSAIGGCAPSPRNDSPVRSRIAVPMSNEASTSTGPAMFGRMSRRSDFHGEYPRRRPATT